MDNQQYLSRNDTLENVISFTLASVENELKKLDDKIVSLENAVNTIIENDGEVSKSIIIDLETKKKKYAKLVNDKIEVELILNRIRKVREDPDIDEEKKFSKIQEITNPFFNSYENSYGAVDVTVDIKNGESQFKKIMKETDKYDKLSKKIEELEQKSAILTARNVIKTNLSYKEDMNVLNNKISKLKTKKIKENSKQKVIMLVRQEKIDKKNKKISKLEAKAKYAKANAKPDKFKKINKRIEKLKNKNIFMMPAPVILFQQSVMSAFSESVFLSDGRLDERTWAERRIEDLEQKSHKKL